MSFCKECSSHLTERLLHIIELFAGAGSGGGLVTKLDLDKMEEKIMSAVSDFEAKVTTAFDAIGASVDGVVQDVQFLKDQIAALQASQGAITPEDQAKLDAIEAKVNSMATKVKALDDATESAPTP